MWQRGVATFRDVLKCMLSDAPTPRSISIGPPTEPAPGTVLWGPVTREAALAAGCVTASSSILLMPADSQGFRDARDAALACIPGDMYPHDLDTPKTLAARLSGCTFLDEIKAKLGGHGRGGRRVDLNSTMYSQPRRVTFSVIAQDATCPETEWMYAYTQHGRPAARGVLTLGTPRLVLR